MAYLDIVPRDKCTGCGMCKSICPKQAITFVEDKEGFLYPECDGHKCVHCGLCEKHCTVRQNVHSARRPLTAFSFYMNQKEELMESASGGLVTALAKAVIENGGSVYACSYSDDFYDAAFSQCCTVENFKNYKSSIYFDTQPMDQNAVKKMVDSGSMCMVVGLPCQIAALRYFIGETDTLLYVSLICGGQESRILHRRVLDEIRSSYPGEEIASVNYRYKKKDWNSSSLRVGFKSGNTNIGGGYFRMEIIRECCYECSYKLDNCFADILAGDFWGSEMLGKEYHNQFGTSAALVLTENGRKWIKKTVVSGSLKEIPVSSTYRTNTAIIKSKNRSSRRDRILKLMNEKSLRDTNKAVLGVKEYNYRRIKGVIKQMLPNGLVRVAKRIKNRL